MVFPSWIWKTGPWSFDQRLYFSAGTTLGSFLVLASVECEVEVTYLEKIAYHRPPSWTGKILDPTVPAHEFILNKVQKYRNQKETDDQLHQLQSVPDIAGHKRCKRHLDCLAFDCQQRRVSSKFQLIKNTETIPMAVAGRPSASTPASMRDITKQPYLSPRLQTINAPPTLQCRMSTIMIRYSGIHMDPEVDDSKCAGRGYTLPGHIEDAIVGKNVELMACMIALGSAPRAFRSDTEQMGNFDSLKLNPKASSCPKNGIGLVAICLSDSVILGGATRLTRRPLCTGISICESSRTWHPCWAEDYSVDSPGCRNQAILQPALSRWSRHAMLNVRARFCLYSSIGPGDPKPVKPIQSSFVSYSRNLAAVRAMADNTKSQDHNVIAVAGPGSESDVERVAEKAAEAGDASQPAIDPAVERKLVWKTDLLLMPALG